MAGEVLVKVEGVSKKFCKDLKTSLWYGVKDMFMGIKGHDTDGELRPKEFWAVKDINFELRRGECLGLIGHNGAGKSTLLKILNGLINPDAGTVTMRGRVGALIELGAGFNPILTGRENIYNNGAVLGFTRKEIDAKVEAIIDFSEIREFIDMPVQNYSSGMKVRLGFAVAAQMEPDVLIIDEVLAVGDLGFVLKCFRTIDVLLKNTAVIFVSHNMPMISRVCDQVILLENGEEAYHGGDVSKGIDDYYKKFVNNHANIVYDAGVLELEKIQIVDANKSPTDSINWGETLSIEICLGIKKNIDIPIFKLVIFDKEQRPVAVLKKNETNSHLKISNHKLHFRITHERNQLTKGIYTLSLVVFKANSIEALLRVNQVLQFQVTHEEDHYQSFLLDAHYKPI
ncbi:ABC transporter ATP-binding protein [Paucihalobacter ruber]|uniref:ABC transporter ATP-binding protein n=1 Tax=Paucihalobacter ruber TaxID=2567861 RepID=A0A506PQA0_9FLAO|nr:ABC transporter ATP-binding protein [Paucihalobacter ruber]TPV35759.1 ABC transporter ATP-binding protein [Paucihalobacter ruber]